MTEVLTNPETEQGYENELVAGFADLADLSADIIERSIDENTAVYEANGSSESNFTGVSLADIEDFMASRYPDADAQEVGVRAAQLFNRIAMEVHGLPELDDLSRLDTSSYTAKMEPSDVLAYAIAHAQDHMEHKVTDGTSSGLEEDKIDNFTSKLDGDDAFKKYHHDKIQSRIQQMGFRRNASKYPNVPDYI
jgi:hypothetical protein